MKVELTVEEVNAILAELAEIPAKYSLNLIGKVRQIAQTQIDAFEKAQKEKADTEKE
jgi:hypothetical protein